jgi:hypothetical protein
MRSFHAATARKEGCCLTLRRHEKAPGWRQSRPVPEDPMKTANTINKKAGDKAPRRIIVGDVHGELAGLKEILSHMDLIDRTGIWRGDDAVLVQTGDVVDRGPHSVEAFQFLRVLQVQAAAAGGQVVRLCGNHELMLLQQDWRYVNFAHPGELARQLRQDILDGTVLASYSDGTRLYTHAGLRQEIRLKVESELSSNSRTTGLKGLSDRLNRIFVECIEIGDLSTHPIFHIDSVRGGRNEVGGIFWGDYSLLADMPGAFDIPQVFAHTPTLRNGVRQSHCLMLIDIDAGMYEGFGGNRVCLEIDRTGEIIEHALKDGKWSRNKLIKECKDIATNSQR